MLDIFLNILRYPYTLWYSFNVSVLNGYFSVYQSVYLVTKPDLISPPAGHQNPLIEFGRYTWFEDKIGLGKFTGKYLK